MVYGGGVYEKDSDSTRTVNDSATISGNSPDQCAGGSLTC
jgi:hypothetical protein